MQVLKDSDVGSTFNRRKGLQKRHSIASCLKRTKRERPPLQRRVSFSKRKTLHLISKGEQKGQWAPSPKLDKENDENEAETEEILSLFPTSSVDTIEEKDEPCDSLEEADILDETMAIDLTTDFSSQFQFLDIPDDEDNTLSRLVAQDDEELSLPSGYISSPANDTNSSNGSTSEITFLGGQLSAATAQDSHAFSENDQDLTESIMELGGETEEILGHTDVDLSTKPLDLDDDFSSRFHIMDQISEKIETGMTAPIENLIEADMETEDLSKIIPHSLEEIAPDEEDKTENFLLDTTETFASNHNISGVFDFSATSSGRRETPLQTPLNFNRQSNGPSSVEDFLSRIHVHFRIFDVTNKMSSCNSLIKIDEANSQFSEEDSLAALLDHKLVQNARHTLLESKNDYYKSEIGSIKEQINEVTEMLEKNNPKCFDSSILCRKQMKEIKKQAQLYAKKCWYEDRSRVQEQYQKYLQESFDVLRTATENLQDKLINIEYPTTATCVLDDYTTKATDTVETQLHQLADDFEILSSLPGWDMTQIDDTNFSFVFNSRYKLDIQFGEQVESKFSLLWSAPRFVIDLINSVSIESFCNVKTLKQLPPGLDEASLWIGRIEDLLEECERIPADVAVNMNVTAAKKGVAVVETIFPASSRFMSSDSVSVNWEIQLNSYPELSLQVTSGPENAALTVQTTMNEITIDQYRYGRLEAICEALLE